MPRKKQVEDAQLLELIDEFFLEKCQGNGALLTLPALADYIAESYPGYQVSTLRRTPLAREYIETLRNNDKSRKLISLVTYKSLDIPHFLATHSSRASLSVALAELDGYYKTIAENATVFAKEYQGAVDKCTDLTKELTDAKSRIDQLESEIASVEERIADLKKKLAIRDQQVQTLNGVIDTYIYPDVANVLLERAGELSQVTTVVNPKLVEENVITMDDSVGHQSKIIRGLFQRFKDTGGADG